MHVCVTCSPDSLTIHCVLTADCRVIFMPSGESPASSEGLSDMDRKQRELHAKQAQLLREQRTADQVRS